RAAAVARRSDARRDARRARISEKVAMQSRRVFLNQGAFACVSLGVAPSFRARPVPAAGDGRRPKQLIAIFQRGAVDGLSVVVPFGEREYYRTRPRIA